MIFFYYTNDLLSDEPTSGDNQNYAHTYEGGLWGDSGTQKYFAICSYIVDGTSP